MSSIETHDLSNETAASSSSFEVPSNYVEDMSWKTPLGKITYLRSLLELRAVSQTIDVYITSLPPQKTSSVLAALKKILPSPVNSAPGFQHLKRLVQPKLIPPPVRKVINEEIDDRLLWFFICPTSHAAQDAIAGAIQSVLEYTPPIYTIRAPRYAPLSMPQAERWTNLYWPTSYKRENPFGPHPPMVDKHALSIIPWIDDRMLLARKAAMAGSEAGFGLCAGAVVCDKEGRVRAVAADARNRSGPLAHAAMRAIRLIAEKRRILGNTEIPREEAGLTDFEREYEGMFGDEVAGYLGEDLIICLTHEPCVMCSMAIVHSRVLGVIYEKDSIGGGLRGDREGGYGMFWRKELNWRFVTFQWNSDKEDPVWTEASRSIKDNVSM